MVPAAWEPAPPVEIVVTGSVVKAHVRRPDFSAGRLRVDGRCRREHPELPAVVPFKYRGAVPEGPVRVIALWPVVSKYGTQLDVLSAEPAADRLEWMGRVLGEVPGVGPVTVERMAERYGVGLPDLLDAPNAAGRLARELAIRGPVAVAIVARWRDLSEWERAFEKAIREAHVNAPVRSRIERYLRERSMWGTWREMSRGLPAASEGAAA